MIRDTLSKNIAKEMSASSNLRKALEKRYRKIQMQEEARKTPVIAGKVRAITSIFSKWNVESPHFHD